MQSASLDALTLIREASRGDAEAVGVMLASYDGDTERDSQERGMLFRVRRAFLLWARDGLAGRNRKRPTVVVKEVIIVEHGAAVGDVVDV